MSYSKYEVFLKVVEYGSMSQAATYCSYSQSAVSQIISTLERDLGVTLLKRSQTGINLTTEGEYLLPLIEELSEAEKSVYAASSKLNGVESGSIKIGTFSSVACNILIPVINKFKKEYPGIQIELREGDNHQTETWLAEGTVDVGFVDMPAPSGFETIPIYTDPFVAVMSTGSKYADQDVISIDTFEKEPMVLYNEGTQKEAAGILRKNKIKANVEYVSRDDRMILSLIENDLCMGFMGELILAKSSFDIVSRPTEPQFYRDIVLAVRSREHASSATKKFIDFIERDIDEVIDELEI